MSDDKSPVVETRLDSVTVIVTQTRYVDGRPVGEVNSQPVKVFLAAYPELEAALRGLLGGAQ